MVARKLTVRPMASSWMIASLSREKRSQARMLACYQANKIAFIKLAIAALNAVPTAEGVETEQQRKILRGLGCTEMQAIC
jgi:EAL domain-containing protein (putative c-di-GMP-specific phosphodiesterase class I)